MSKIAKVPVTINTPTPIVGLDEYFEISRALEQYHVMFYKFWEMGKPVFTDTLATCGVRFNKEGRFVEFAFNPKFWARLNNQERIFIICHECLHLLLNHGERGINSPNHDEANIAMDVAVNHMLVESFGFVRDQLPVAKEGCWVDTVFESSAWISTDESFEYYANRLADQKKHNKGSGQGQGKGKIFDDHSQLSECDIQEIVENLNEALTNDEKKELNNKINVKKQNGSGRGTTPLGDILKVPDVPVVKKNVWKQIIKKYTKMWYADNQSEQWARTNRRFAAVAHISDLILPTDHEVEDFENNRVEVWIFLDASGSCASLKGKFFNMAKSIPEDYFHVRVFSFDTRVHELDMKNAYVKGGGGTSFQCVELQIKELMQKEKRKYPQAVFMITDGAGDEVKPMFPDRWYWFLSAQMDTTCIPKDSHIYSLDEIDTKNIAKECKRA